MKFTNALKLDLMSSEESDIDDDEEILVLHPLPWRSEKVDQMFVMLDNETMKSKSPQAHRQMKRRVSGDESERSVPFLAESEGLKWIIRS